MLYFWGAAYYSVMIGMQTSLGLIRAPSKQTFPLDYPKTVNEAYNTS
ncbi:hypothetical protein DB42_AZ00110 [Neochlamydia sp. EPS4]|nr:hypothetical protein DB42_AZ00110 [Neochlamydia sp. EPS4]